MTGAVNVLLAKSAFLSNISVPKIIVVSLDILSWLEEGVTWKAGCNGLVTHPASSITICEVVPRVLPNPITKSSAESSNPIW